MNSDFHGLTSEECKQLEWCQAILDEDQLSELKAEAYEIAVAEAYVPKAAEIGLPLLVKLMAHRIEEEIVAAEQRCSK
jgi:hypothetical protein